MDEPIRGLVAAADGLLPVAEELPDVAGAGPTAEATALDAGLSAAEAFATTVKCLLGAGVFSLPLAFSRAGWLASAALTLLMAGVSTSTMEMLVQSERRVAQILDVDRLTYPQLVAHALDGLVPARVADGLVRALITGASVLVSAAYVAFVTTTLAIELGTPRGAVLLACFAAEACLCQLRDFRWLSRASALGNAAIGLGCAVVVAYGARRARAPLAGGLLGALGAPVHWRALPRVLGPLAFSFAVHFTLLPVGQAMRAKGEFARLVGRAFGLLALFDCAFALSCTALYGDTLRANVLDSMADRGPAAGGSLASAGAAAAAASKWLLAVSLLLTVPLILAAARELVEEALLARVPRLAPRREIVSTCVRLALVAVACGLVWLVADFGVLVTIAGGVAAAACGFVLPPLVHLRTHGTRLGAGARALRWGICLFGCGVLASSLVFVAIDLRASSRAEVF